MTALLLLYGAAHNNDLIVICKRSEINSLMRISVINFYRIVLLIENFNFIFEKFVFASSGKSFSSYNI